MSVRIFSEMLGLIFTTVEKRGDDELRFETEDGAVHRFLHRQDCCESVYIEHIDGDLEDLVGEPMVQAEEVSSEDPRSVDAESYTWSFYKFATRKGFVTVRYLGTSNGYYGEKASYEVTT